MENYVIIGILVMVLGAGIYSMRKHFRHESGCCGGGSYKPKKKRLKNVMAQKTLIIQGMHCEHCENRVTEALNDMEGVAARVSYKKGTAVVLLAQLVEEETLKEAVERVGYEVVEVRNESKRN